MPQLKLKSEGGFAVAGVLAILLAVGTIIGATLHLAPVSSRAAVREQHAVQALANAESGLAHALAWLESDAFNPTVLSGSGAFVIVGDRSLGDGGYRNVTIEPRTGSEYVVTATGYQAGADGREVTRRVQTAVRITSASSGALFPRHWLSFPPGYESDSSHPTNDPDDEAFGYVPIDIEVPPVPNWSRPNYGPKSCANVTKTPRDVTGETCRWAGSYSLNHSSSPARIENAKVTVTGDMDITSSWELSGKNSTISVDGNLRFGGWGGASRVFEDTTIYVGKQTTFGEGSQTTFKGETAIYTESHLNFVGSSGKADFTGDTTLYVGGNMNVAEGATISFQREATVYVNGDLIIEGNAKLNVYDGATFYVNGNVNIKGSGWTSGSGGSEAPWIVFYVCKGLNIEGGAGAGASVPDVAFVLDTVSPHCQHHPVTLKGSGRLNGGIYAPTRVVTIESSSPVVGSLVGLHLNIPQWRDESGFRNDYTRHRERMQSFTLTTPFSSDNVERLPEWREMR